jgi:hypothetical protein
MPERFTTSKELNHLGYKNKYFIDLCKTTSFVMFCNMNRCQLYYRNCIVQLVEDIYL